MPVQALSLPDAEDSNLLDVKPARDLEVCDGLLDDHAALTRFYEDNGYIFLRDALNQDSVRRARDEMLVVAARRGLIAPGDAQARWTGHPLTESLEESPDFAGVSQRLIAHPDNLKLMEKVLGEPACMVPNVQYRIYPPRGPITRIHQDGFYSPGIQDYKPLWIPLTPCTRAMGGLAIAVRQNKRGYLHNLAKPSPYPIPAKLIPDDSWATTDYQPGDVLIVHPYTPHGSLPNTSDRLRVSFDTRVQSAARPSAFAATVKAVTPSTITVACDNGEDATFKVDEDTFIRVLNPGVRNTFAEFSHVTKPGMRLIVVKGENDNVAMLRKAAEG